MKKYINQNNKYIYGDKYTEKIDNMIANGYGCITIDGTKVTYKDTLQVEDDEIIIVHIGDEEECESGIDYVI